jgi:hypothetical protein
MALNNLDQQIDSKMRELGVSRDFVAMEAGISRTLLADACRGTGTLGTERGLKIWGILRDLETLRNLAEPFPIAFNNVAVIQNLLRRLRDGDEFPRLGSRAQETGEECAGKLLGGAR